MSATRFGTLYRITYNVNETDADALRSGDLNPDIAYVSADGVPSPERRDGGTRFVGAEWRLDLDPPVVIVTFWRP